MISDEKLEAIERCANDHESIAGIAAKELVAEIRRLRAAIKKLNTCVECGEPNPQDNICEDCWKSIQDETV